MRQAYDYWQDQPGSPRRGTQHTSSPGQAPDRESGAPRPAFDTRPTRTRKQSIRDATTERFSPEVHSPMSRIKATHRSTHQHAIARLRKGRNANALAANSARAQRTANADRHAERHIERPLKERSPMLSLGSASRPPTRPLNRSRPRKAEKTQPSSAATNDRGGATESRQSGRAVERHSTLRKTESRHHASRRTSAAH